MLGGLRAATWEYDITTGQSVFDPTVPVVTYPVEVSNGEIAVTIS
jgi:nitrite reductase/ring-hydroxylating ferredoxin subunit